MSIALRVLPSKLELNRRDGSATLAPRANVSFTTSLYVSPVQTIPLCDQTGTPTIPFDGFFHFCSSIISGSASRISARMRASVSTRQSSCSTGADASAFNFTVLVPCESVRQKRESWTALSNSAPQCGLDGGDVDLLHGHHRRERALTHITALGHRLGQDARRDPSRL